MQIAKNVHSGNRPRIPAEPYHFPHDSSLSSATTALVIIDMQRDFCEIGGYFDCQGYDVEPARAIIPAVQSLLSAFRAAEYPVYFTREGHRPDLSTLSSRERFRSRNNPKGLGIGDTGPLGRFLVRGELGHDIILEAYPLPGETVIDKPGRGAFAHTDFEHLLKLQSVRNLVFAGVTTDVCVSSTMREANDRGFDCLLLGDASAAGTTALHNYTIESVKMEGGIFGCVGNYQDVVEALKLDQGR